jgi:redox-sensitive bicupin YhaK (pirin superfamily)
MPAITADTLTLPKIVEPPADAASPRAVASVTTAPQGLEGEGFPVRRAFAGVSSADLDPFIMMDQMGEVNYAPGEPKGTPWHPHRGFETVTYLVDGTFLHQDSHGGGGVITDGGTQWMTAGGGILHIETPPEDLVIRGGLFHGFQLWVNLPAKDKMIAPAYQSLEPGSVTLLTTPDAGVLVRLIAGEIGGHRGPGSTHTPIVVAHLTLPAGTRAVLPWNPDFNALAYAMAGSGFAGAERAAFRTGQLARFERSGDSVILQAADGESLDVILLGGEPIGEPVAHHGPFVMNNRAELQQALDDFQAGRMGVIPAGGIQPFRG